MKIGAFGWGTHEPKSGNANREAKTRPCIVVLQNAGRFLVLFGRSEPRADWKRKVSVDPRSEVGMKWGLRQTTYFHQELAIMPGDFVCKGCFATDSDHDSDDIKDYDLWLEIRALVAPRR